MGIWFSTVRIIFLGGKILKKRTKILIALLLIGLTAFWFAADMPLRTALMKCGVSPFNITVYNREKQGDVTIIHNGIHYKIDEVLVVKGKLHGSSSPVLMCLQRSKLGHWFISDHDQGDNPQIKWHSLPKSRDSAYKLSVYGENAIAPIYIAEGQLTKRISTEIIQDGAQYYICLSCADPMDLTDVDLEQLLVANGCIPPSVK